MPHPLDDVARQQICGYKTFFNTSDACIPDKNKTRRECYCEAFTDNYVHFVNRFDKL